MQQAVSTKAVFTQCRSLTWAPTRCNSALVSSQFFQKADDRIIDLCCAFLLRPVPTPRQHDLPSQLGYELAQIWKQLIHAFELHHQISIARDIECEHDHLRSFEWFKMLPIRIYIPVIVKPAAEPCPLELSCIKVDVSFTDPARECRRVDKA